MKETPLVRQCVGWLRLYGAFVWRANVGAVTHGNRFIAFNMKGVSDIIGCMPDGKFIAVECKVGKRKCTEEQVYFLSMIAKCNGIALVVCDDTRELEELLSRSYTRK